MSPTARNPILAVFVVGTAAIVTSQAGDPQAAYPKPFSRPPSMGNDYDTWRDAKGSDIGATNPDVSRLPSRVDNSTRPQFPPIYKQVGGACGQFTAIASIFTYEMNLHNGTRADTEATRFPADFSWNMCNAAQNRGSEAYHGRETAKHIGIPSVKSYGSVHGEKIGVWPDGYHIWREAMEYRVSGYRYTPIATTAQIDEARGWLFDRNQPREDGTSIGGLLALDGRMGERQKVTKTIADGEHMAGEDLWIRWGPSGYGHGITCVGYDDKVGYDLNGDGEITNDTDINGDGKVTLADWERGAFIVVNSWGADWSADGKIYLLYSAMVDPTWERGNFLGRVEVARHVPRHTLKLRLGCDKRSELRLTIGFARDQNASKPDREFAPQHLNGWPLFGIGRNNVGEVPLAGPGDEKPLELSIDLTPLLGAEDPEGRLFLRLGCSENSTATGLLHDCSFRSYDACGIFVREATVKIADGSFGDTPLTIETILHP